MKKLIVAGFFIVVFVLPISWYLILQIFGENKFDIPKFEMVADSCRIVDGAYLQLNAELWETKRNELTRIKRRFESVSDSEMKLIMEESCLKDNAAVLVDEEGYYRGFYKASREETDRILTEVDIYLTNIEKSERE
ncbi:hypothetical protein [Marinoscillum sp. MHG1-6]|uniref:hypothetical protein n=1 Tax=Marinoscillum sp. MHG1-6 TaxID=2959627 RepID=UPI002157C2B5|nr:hypothetical protein [Marinoscillum sp. MHG1-6]